MTWHLVTWMLSSITRGSQRILPPSDVRQDLIKLSGQPETLDLSMFEQLLQLGLVMLVWKLVLFYKHVCFNHPLNNVNSKNDIFRKTASGCIPGERMVRPEFGTWKWETSPANDNFRYLWEKSPEKKGFDKYPVNLKQIIPTVKWLITKAESKHVGHFVVR